MKLENIRPGDRLRIRLWEDMEAEFGLDDDGYIPCELFFAPEMKCLCGREFTVASINPFGVIIAVDLYGSDPLEDWSVSAGMCEPAVTEDPWSPPDVNPAELFSVLFGGN